MSDDTEGAPRDAAREDGLVIVYTGDGKGKTTAALGVALRTVGYGRKVLIIQFIKGTWHYGEIEALARLPEVTLVRAGAGFYKIVDDHFPDEVHRAAAREGLALAQRSIAANEHALIILDEINVAVALGLLDVADALALIDARPAAMSLILTGRNAHPDVIARADLVTEMREIKHPYGKGVLAKKGIDY